MSTNKKIIYLTASVVLLIFISLLFIKNNSTKNVIADTTSKAIVTKTDPKNIIISTTSKDIIIEPISNALSRVTKKPFGIKVSPGHSPITPEKFSGYHTGVDFETTVAEQNIDVPVYALCDGNLLVKKTATGYGGVVVQKCTLSGQIVNIIYGHLKLSSVSAKVGAKLNAGTQIGILGKAYSAETDGERKHLHLGIHKGSSINILGYVKYQSSLKDWLDVTKYLPNISQSTK